MPVDTPGAVLAGRYQLVEKLGQGGMGSVWRGLHLELNTPIALKLIDSSIAQDAGHLIRFRREAQAAAALRSPYVVQILDYGVDEGTPFIAMELLEGETLAERLGRVGSLPPETTAKFLNQLARALTKAHELGIVHRDLKPGNLFIVHDGEEELVKVLDFGVAKRQSELLGDSNVPTRTGTLLGTPYYMSPEQGAGRKPVDHRTDLWAMAVIAFECLTGRRPFNSDNLGSLLVSICTEPAPVPSEVGPVPPGFDEWFARGVEKAPEARFQSAREAARELSRIVGGFELPPGSSLVPAQSSKPGDTLVVDNGSLGPTASWIPAAVTRGSWRSLALGASLLGLLLVAGAGLGLALMWRGHGPLVSAATGSESGARPPFISGQESALPPAAETARPPSDRRASPAPSTVAPPQPQNGVQGDAATGSTGAGRPGKGRGGGKPPRPPMTTEPPAQGQTQPKPPPASSKSRLDTDPGF